LCYVVRFTDSAYRQTIAHALIELLPFGCRHVLPQVRPDNSRTHCVHANWRQLQRQGACHGLGGSADACGNNPSFARAPTGNSRGQHNRATLANILASVLDSGESRPITQLKGSSGLFQMGGGKVPQVEAISSGEYQVIERTKRGKESFDGLFVREVNDLSLRVYANRFNRPLDSFRVAGGDNDLGAL